MQFPVIFEIAGFRVPAHLVFETAAYAFGFAAYRRQRRCRGDELSFIVRLQMIAAAICGAALGSKLLHHVNDWSGVVASGYSPSYLMGGRTIVGGLAGGLVAVEGTKRLIGLRTRTGDLYALPLCLGIAVGRIGCFLTGVDDDTWGRATQLPWGMKAGDGLVRHPAPLYEILFLGILAAGLSRWRPRLRARPGREFQVFLAAYMSFRFAVDFIKPQFTTILGMTPIQIVAASVALQQMCSLLRGSESRKAEIFHG
jgi:phosphatidylglycerol---prolipoprotein diacylglyceryl transferase